ncbi:MAG: phosphoenolpyruvate--protein phosphotransferase [Ignavibacteria bacterium]|nr:phosphoenolpyruvate--protein phosphotransferase [Ignavibacteria bacterium]MCU7501487.1 phosphoenolpyruvate--protein phosphotransferase [Ignavibacteria bacterium]MCU7515997.1 phosphoenolpyruvate--protein phosphotransferase [Ignavibacteria bacterium]
MKKLNVADSNILNGIAAAPGIAIAHAYLYEKEKLEIKDGAVTDTKEAVENLKEAIERSKYELRKVFTIATEKMGKNRAAIFEAQLMILDDPVLIEQIIRRIETEKRLPEFIVNDEITRYQELMNASDELYMKERSQDIEDIKNRIIRNLQKKRLQSKITSQVIVVTSSLTPADTILFSKSNVKGYITDFGGLTSHAAIVSRSLKIPAVVGTHDATSRIENGDLVIMDGFHGIVILKPDETQLSFYRNKIEKLTQFDKELAELKDKPAVTLDGKEIVIRGNIDITDEVDFLVQNGAKGIGLLRTEQVFGGLDTFPGEDEQFVAYHELAEKIYPEYVIIRAFDVGGDKFLPHDVKEPNPFLGWRGIRFLLDNPEIFKTQIRAILRASIHKNIKLMLPMVVSLEEVKRSKALLKECKDELRKEKIKFDQHLNLGIMIEVPSAAVLAKEFANEVDFLSIGTNDLIQFLLAVDRGNEIVSMLYQEFHPAVIRTINQIIKNGQRGHAFVSMCGEMAGDTIAIPLLVGMGLDSLSVSPSSIPYIKRIIRNLHFSKAQELAGECLGMSSLQEVTERIEKFFSENLIQQTNNFM